VFQIKFRINETNNSNQYIVTRFDRKFNWRRYMQQSWD